MRLSILIALALTAIAFGGCGPTGDGGDPRPALMSIGTAPQGGTFYVIGSAIAEVLSAHGDEAGWQVTAEATKGSQENIRRLAKGEIEIALANSAITYFAGRGEAGWDQAYPVRALMTLAPNVALFVAPEANTTYTLPQSLSGRRMLEAL